jgi:hypothetical protein
MSLKIQLGPLVAFSVEGESCRERAAALEGFEALNRTVDAMCSDLAERVYPEEAPKPPAQGESAS